MKNAAPPYLKYTDQGFRFEDTQSKVPYYLAQQRSFFHAVL
jgi:hypothetical protein